MYIYIMTQYERNLRKIGRFLYFRIYDGTPEGLLHAYTIIFLVQKRKQTPKGLLYVTFCGSRGRLGMKQLLQVILCRQRKLLEEHDTRLESGLW